MQLVLGKGHDKGVDYWALGILLYEQVAGYSPFADSVNNDQMVICRNILKGDVEFPAHFKDKDLKDLILRFVVEIWCTLHWCGFRTQRHDDDRGCAPSRQPLDC